MQTAQELTNVVIASYKTPPGSLRHFGRFGAVALGVIGGFVSVASATGAKESALRAAIAERDNTIAQLTAAKDKLEKVVAGDEAKPSSGDPVQDWIDALAE